MYKKMLNSALFILCLMTGQIAAADTPPVIDTFRCNYTAGKGAGDLTNAISFWNQQMDKLESEAMKQYSAWLITPVRSSLPYDFYWLGVSPNFTNWTQGNTDYAMSKEGQAAEERFAKMSRCTSAAWTPEQIFGPTEPRAAGSTSMLEAFGCTLKEGKTMSNVRAVEANFANEAKAAGMDMRIFRFSPMYTDGQVDLLYFIGHDSAAALAANGEKGWNSKDLRIANAFFDMVMDCGGGLYSAENIRMGSGAGNN